MLRPLSHLLKASEASHYLAYDHALPAPTHQQSLREPLAGNHLPRVLQSNYKTLCMYPRAGQGMQPRIDL